MFRKKTVRFLIDLGIIIALIVLVMSKLEWKMEVPSGYDDVILNDYKNEPYFKKLKLKYTKIADEHNELNDLANIKILTTTTSLTSNELEAMGHHYLSEELQKGKKPSLLIIDINTNDGLFYGQITYSLKSNITKESITANSYDFRFQLAHIKDISSDSNPYQTVNDLNQPCENSFCTFVNYTAFIENPILYEDSKRYQFIKNHYSTQGIILADVYFLYTNPYTGGLTSKFVPLGDSTSLSLYEDGDYFVVGVKSNLPISYKMHYYEVEINSYCHEIVDSLNAYFFELYRIKKTEHYFSSEFSLISHQLIHNDMELINDAFDIQILHKTWKYQEFISFKEYNNIYYINQFIEQL